MAYLVFLLVYPIVWLFSQLPLRILYVFSDGLYVLMYRVIGYRKKVVMKNLRNSFPEKSEAELQEIARKFYHFFADTMVETIKLFTISQKELQRRVKYINPEVLEDLYDKHKQVIVISGHYGNWEWFAGLVGATRYHCMSVYKPLSNKHIEKAILKSRTRFGADIVPMHQTLKTILGYIKTDTLTLSGLISDQRPMKSEIQYWTTFLNQPTPMYLGPEKIAMKTNQAIVFHKMNVLKRGFYEVEVIKLFEETKDLPPHAITEAHTRVLEDIIKASPQYWLWTHNRWKYTDYYYNEVVNKVQ